MPFPGSRKYKWWAEALGHFHSYHSIHIIRLIIHRNTRSQLTMGRQVPKKHLPDIRYSESPRPETAWLCLRLCRENRDVASAQPTQSWVVSGPSLFAPLRNIKLSVAFAMSHFGPSPKKSCFPTGENGFSQMKTWPTCCRLCPVVFRVGIGAKYIGSGSESAPVKSCKVEQISHL